MELFLSIAFFFSFLFVLCASYFFLLLFVRIYSPTLCQCLSLSHSQMLILCISWFASTGSQPNTFLAPFFWSSSNDFAIYFRCYFIKISRSILEVHFVFCFHGDWKIQFKSWFPSFLCLHWLYRLIWGWNSYSNNKSLFHKSSTIKSNWTFTPRIGLFPLEIVIKHNKLIAELNIFYQWCGHLCFDFICQRKFQPSLSIFLPDTIEIMLIINWFWWFYNLHQVD